MRGPPDRWWRGFDSLILDVAGPGSRVLDVGCGDGGLVKRLRERGLDALGVDPCAPADPHLLQHRVEDLGTLGSFDAVCAVMSLHHAALEAVLPKVADLIRAGGVLLIYDFAWETYDERAGTWLDAHDTTRADNTIAGWSTEHAGLHSGETMRAALTEHLTLRSETPRPYLARMLGLPALEPEELTLIDSDALPALGRHWIATCGAS